jgi:hypothetical protein
VMNRADSILCLEQSRHHRGELFRQCLCVRW